jgi:hypothetical protein
VERKSWLLPVLWVVITASAQAQGQAPEVTNQYDARLWLYHNISGALTGFGYLEYRRDPQDHYRNYRLGWPGITYLAKPWFQIWTGLVSSYTVNEYKADQWELRPYVGSKVFLPNKRKMNLYNYTRYEYRFTQDRDSRDWSESQRIRSRFGAEIPLTSVERAWQPKTFYLMADSELFSQFDKTALNAWTVRGGVGYVTHDRLRLEFTYSARFDRGGSNDALEYDRNIFRLNIKVGLHHGILDRTSNPGSGK